VRGCASITNENAARPPRRPRGDAQHPDGDIRFRQALGDDLRGFESARERRALALGRALEITGAVRHRDVAGPRHPDAQLVEPSGPAAGDRLEGQQVVAPAHLGDLAQRLSEVVRILEQAAAGEVRDLGQRFLAGAPDRLARALGGIAAGGEAAEVDGVDHGVGGGERAERARHLFADLGVAEAILALHLPEPPAHHGVRVGERLRRALPAQRGLFEPAGEQHHLLAALHDLQRGRELPEPLEQGKHLLAIDGLLRALEADLHGAHGVDDRVARLFGQRIGHRRAHLAQVEGQSERVGAPVELQHAERFDRARELCAVGCEG